MFNTPILLLVFNRPQVTQRVFDQIRKQKPKYLYVAADGARPNVFEDIEKCKITRGLVLNGVDWDCEVKTLFRDENLGCGLAVSSAISWFFENVEQGIILEDDCLPHPSFFGYCEIVLERYKDDERIYGITGDNFQNGILRGNSSYYFSRYFHIWGWASWRRVWIHYDYNLKHLEKFNKNKIIYKIDKRKIFENYWLSIFKKTAKKEIDTWDYQLLFSLWNNGGLIVTPNVNLISNIGFGKDATHTTEASAWSKMDTRDIGILIHPKLIQADKKADRYVSDTGYNIRKRRKYTFKIFKGLIQKVLNIAKL